MRDILTESEPQTAGLCPGGGSSSERPAPRHQGDAGTCASCGHDNGGGAKYCEECGTRLQVACGRCGGLLPDDAGYCSQCGRPRWAEPDGAPRPRSPAPAEPAAIAVSGERRQVTVLFSDLVGSTELAARLDPEEWQEICNQYHHAAAAAVTRFDGYVAKYLGDGLLVYFGYPQAHDDDAERAVRAGLAIRDALRSLNQRLESAHGVRLAVRVGMHTGPVVIGRGGDEQDEVFGGVPNVAARVQAAAEPNSVFITGVTQRIVAGVFVVEECGAQPLKGISAPVPLFRVLQPSGVRSRFDHRVRLSPFVGREREIGVLLDRWARAREGSGQAVLISGEPGVGKSRLVHALRQRLADQPHTWLECRGTPYMQHSAFHPIIELVEQGLAFEARDTPEDKTEKLERGFALAGFPARETLPLMAAFLSIPLTADYPPLRIGGELQRRRTLDALTAWCLALGKLQPVFLLVEDLQWCDPSSLELIGRLIAQTATVPLMTLLTARPEFLCPPWGQRPTFRSIKLPRLTRRQGRAMVAGLHPRGALPKRVLDLIIARADGVPLFIEELTRAVAETDAAKAVVNSGGADERRGQRAATADGAEVLRAIPATLQDSLMARLDRMGSAKTVAQRASVLGREFTYTLLAASAGLDESMLRQGLDHLVDAELLFQRGEPPDATYAFTHALIQETAYQSLLKRTRRALHARIGQALEQQFPARAATQPEVVARHYAAAGWVERAVPQYLRAGERTTARSAHEEAIAHLRAGLALLETLPEKSERDAHEIALQLSLGSSLIQSRGHGHPDTEAAYERARILCDANGDTAQLGSALVGLCLFYQNRGDLARARALAQRVLEIGARTGDDARLLQGHLYIGIIDYYQGRFASALEHCEEVLRIYDPSRHESAALAYGVDQRVAALAYIACSVWHRGGEDLAVAYARQAVATGRTLGHPFSLAFALFFATKVHGMRRDSAAERATAAEVIAMSEAHGFPLLLGVAKMLRGAARAVCGAGKNAIDEALAGLSLAASTGTQAGAPGLIATLVEAHQAVGDHAAAGRALEAALALSAHTAQPFWDADLHRLRGELLLHDATAEPGAPTPEDCFRRALEIARAQGSQSFAVRAATSLARLLGSQGRADEARSLLAPLYAAFTEGFDTRDLREARTVLAELNSHDDRAAVLKFSARTVELTLPVGIPPRAPGG